MQDALIWLDRFGKVCAQEVQRKPADQRAIHEKLGARMLTGLRGNVSGMLNDAHGHVAGWQSKYVGSGGGYAAVRAIDSSTGPNSPGAITNYLENGHAIRRPRGRSPGYRPRVRVLYVSGHGFYDAYRGQLSKMLQTEVRNWGREVTSRISGV